MKTQLYIAMAFLLVATIGCEKGNRSYSLLPDEAAFNQSVTYVPRKIDVLWVVDNSGSMQSSQEQLAASFPAFIQKFQDLRFDFRMAVTTSDAWVGQFNGNTSLFRFKDGINPNRTGVFVVDRNTPDLSRIFVTNASVGIAGNGDERAFQSFANVLSFSGNSDFRRPDAHLAVIIVSDEDDFSSRTSTYLNNNYNATNLIPVSEYVTYMNTLAGANDLANGVHNWSVNAVAILDTACRDQLNTSFTGRRVGTRYIQLAQASGGVTTSLCDDFGNNLKLISDVIFAASSVFQLNREPQIGTIRVTVDGVLIPEDPVNGWTYNPANMQISFHGTAIPSAGAQVLIGFEPVAPKE